MPITNSKIGKNVKIPYPELVNIYGATIGKNCFIGPFVEIQKGVKIGDNTRISSHTFICEGVNIGSDVFVAHGVMFINDLDPKANNKNWKLSKTVVCKRASIGSNATILPVKLGKNCLIGAGAVVTKNVKNNSVVAGNPARLLNVSRETKRK